jgi:dGTPase
MLIREFIEDREQKTLALYAQASCKSLGRKYKEEECPMRTRFFRDMGRIIHSTAFRLLEYKTQVFVNDEGDYYRTRLTHSLEVSQMSQGIARVLIANEDLAKTIALAHDLGHPPFGHSGETALNALMKNDGGFEHNLQSYRVVTELEECYPNFRGLNLSYEVLEGILKHSTDYDKPSAVKDFKNVGYPTIEAQIVNLADEIAFMNHDLDDGIHWGMLSVKSLKDVKFWDETYKEIQRAIPSASEKVKRTRTISSLIGKLITDLVTETKDRILSNNIKTIDDVRANGKNIVSFSEEITKKTREAKDFLFQNMYKHENVVKMAKRAEKAIEGLFKAYLDNPKLLPDRYSKRLEADGSNRHICDYIAGMTDRFALQQFKKIVDQE